jgi:rifampicin phosphotransferase
MDFIRWFGDLDRDAVAQAGGKGANLGDMVRAGLPVPPGFVLLTPAYRAFVAAAGLQPEVVQICGEARPDDTATVEAASAAIRALFAGAAMPPEIAAATLQAYRDLGQGRVAVRSSATAEDLPGASFAGQQETYLNIEGEEQLLAAVQRCWSSLWTGRAIAYRARQGIGPEEVALAVVVQRQVEAESAGVLFTANPVNGRRDQMTIDGAWGLGEAVVSGQVTPDHWVADGPTGAILEAHTAGKEVMTTRRDGATATVPVPDDLRNEPVLMSDQVAALVALGRQVAAHFGGPQDIEWAWADGRFYLVQSRPITSLFPLPAPEPGPDLGLRAYVSFNIIQGFVEPMTPMGIATFRSVVAGFAGLWGIKLDPDRGSAAQKVAALRMYLDVTDGLHHRRVGQFVQKFPAVVDRQIAEILQHVAKREPGLQPVPGAPGPRPRLGFFLPAVGRVVRAIIAPAGARRRALAIVEASMQRLEADAAHVSGVAERVRFVQERMPDLFPLLVGRLLPLLIPGVGSGALARAKVAKWLGDIALLNPVMRSLPHNPTTEMDMALWRLSRQLKAEGAAPSPDHPGVKAFLAQYGHRAVREIDLGMPRWTDAPTHVLNVLETYLTHGDEEDPEVKFRQGAEEAERVAVALVERVRREKGRLRAAALRFLISRGRALAGMREYPKFYAVRLIALFRKVLAGAGAELAAAGRLDRAEDVFFLELRDIKAGGDLRAIVAANRAEYAREMGRRSIPRVITSLGETFYTAPTTTPGALTGTAASPGVFEGRVRVIHDPQGAKLEPGEILVAPGTDPAWTPLFLTAGALVMEIGGMMSHGSVVAREYGIPAVVGVAGATQRLQTGQRIRVDGESGVVVPLE